MLAAAPGLSGSVYLAGYSEGDWSNSTANMGGKDFAAVSLDVDGALQWEWQVKQIAITPTRHHQALITTAT